MIEVKAIRRWHKNTAERQKCQPRDNKCPSTHLLPLICDQVAEATGPGEKPYIPLPSNTFQLILGDPKAFPGQRRYKIPPANSVSSPGSPAMGRAWKSSGILLLSIKNFASSYMTGQTEPKGRQ